VEAQLGGVLVVQGGEPEDEQGGDDWQVLVLEFQYQPVDAQSLALPGLQTLD
jgi:hypothetical protein